MRRSLLRDPIQAKDQLYNLGWNPDEEIRVAFGGLIDLDGDGIDNNDDSSGSLDRPGSDRGRISKAKAARICEVRSTRHDIEDEVLKRYAGPSAGRGRCAKYAAKGCKWSWSLPRWAR